MGHNFRWMEPHMLSCGGSRFFLCFFFLPWELLASGKLGNSRRASLKVYGLTYLRFTHRGCMVHSFILLLLFFQFIKKQTNKQKTLRYIIGMLPQSPVNTSSVDHANGLPALSCVCGSTTILWRNCLFVSQIPN